MFNEIIEVFPGAKFIHFKYTIRDWEVGALAVLCPLTDVLCHASIYYLALMHLHTNGGSWN